MDGPMPLSRRSFSKATYYRLIRLDQSMTQADHTIGYELAHSC